MSHQPGELSETDNSPVLMTEPRIRKPRSLQTSWGDWGGGGATHKHFRVNGADPTDGPSTSTVRKNRAKLCKKSPDHEHHFVVTAERVYWRSEYMVDQCSYCGKKKGGFTVWIVKPEWIKKLEQQRRVRL